MGRETPNRAVSEQPERRKGLPMSKQDSRRAKIRAGQKRGSAESAKGIDQKEKTMERKILERRSVLKGGMAAAGMLGSGASTATVAV